MSGGQKGFQLGTAQRTTGFLVLHNVFQGEGSLAKSNYVCLNQSYINIALLSVCLRGHDQTLLAIGGKSGINYPKPVAIVSFLLL